MSCNITNGIQTGCNNSIGGLKTIRIANSYTGYQETSGYITSFQGVTEWFEFDVDNGGASFTETYEVNKNGNLLGFRQSVTLQLNGLDAAIQTIVKEMAEATTMVVVVQDNNDTYWTVGIDRGAFLETGSSTTGTAYTDIKAATLTITGIEPTSTKRVAPSIFLNISPTPYTIAAAFRVTNVPVNDIPWGQSFGYTALTSKQLVVSEMPNLCDSTYEGTTGVTVYLEEGATFGVGTTLYNFFGQPASLGGAYVYGLYTTNLNNYCNGNLLTDVYQLTYTANGNQIATMTPLGQVT